MTGPPPGEPDVIVLADPDAVSEAAAARFAMATTRAVAARGRADVATTGGSTPAGLYRRLRDGRIGGRVDWARLHLWFGDERFVPRTDGLSNAGIVDRILLGDDDGDGENARAEAPPLPADHVHAVPVDAALAAGRDAAWAARRYGREIGASVPRTARGIPRFDLVIVGIGPDGHLLSVFPRSTAFASRAVAVAVPAPVHLEPHVERVTLSPRVLAPAAEVLVVAHGSAKAAILRRVLQGPRTPFELPAQLARRSGATWLLDTAAARELGQAS